MADVLASVVKTKLYSQNAWSVRFENEITLVFISDVRTNVCNRDDPSENEIARKHKNKQNQPKIPTVQARGNVDPVFSPAKHNHVWQI